MAYFDPQNQLLASLQIYVDNTLDELSDIAEGNIERWKVGLRDVQNWDDEILAQERLVLNDVDPEFNKLFSQIVDQVPDMKEFIHVFMIEICKLSSIRNREYFTRFGHRDRGDLQKTVLTKVFRKLNLTPKTIVPQHTAMHLNPNDSVSCVPRDVEVSTHSKREEAFSTSRPSSKISAITQNDQFSRPPSIRRPSPAKLSTVREPSMRSRQSRVTDTKDSVIADQDPAPAVKAAVPSTIVQSVPEDECKLFSIISQRDAPDLDNAPSQSPTIRLSSVGKPANDLESVSKKFPEAYNDLMSGVSLMR